MIDVVAVVAAAAVVVITAAAAVAAVYVHKFLILDMVVCLPHCNRKRRTREAREGAGRARARTRSWRPSYSEIYFNFLFSIF